MLHLKYAPKQLSECVANLNVIKDLTNYLESTTENTVCVVYGNIGSGKTVTVNLVLKDLHLHKTEINYTEKINKSNLLEKLEKTQNTVIIFEDSQFYNNDLYICLNSYYKNRKSLKKIIIISDIVFSKIYNVNIISIETKITNIKIYQKFIKNIMNMEKIKKSFILKYIDKYSNNIRSCITNLDSTSMYYNTNDNNLIHCINKLSNTNDIDDKINIINDNYINIQYLYFENIHMYDIDIKTRLKVSNAMIFCDTFNTLGYNTQNWEYIKYILYVSTINTSNILQTPPLNLTKSTIWSTYSNLCSKTNKINVLLANSCFEYNYEIIKYIQNLLIHSLNNSNEDKIEYICKKYNIKTFETLNDILQIGYVKKKVFKNIKLIKGINK